MIAPANYLLNTQQFNPTQGITQGVNLANLIQQGKAVKAETEILQQQQENAKNFQIDASNLALKGNQTAKDYSDLILKYPKQAEVLKKSYDLMTEGQQKEAVSIGTQVFSALNANQPEIAKGILQKRLEAAEKSGNDKEVASNKVLLQIIDTDADAAKTTAGLYLANALGDKDFSNVMTKMENLKYIPAEQKIKENELQIKRENTKLRTLEAQLRKADNDLKRQDLQLKIDAQKTKLEEKKAEIEQNKVDRVAEAQSSIATFDNALATLEDIKSHPGLEKATGMSSFLSIIPGTEAKDFAEIVNTFESQSFLAEVQKMKGLGALSENEGKKLSSAIVSLNRDQTEGQFKKNLDRAIEIFKLGKSRMEKKYKKDLAKQPTKEIEKEMPTQTIKEGTVIQNDAGQKMILRGGTWQPM